MTKIRKVLLLVCFAGMLSQCTRQTDEFKSDQLIEYLNLSPGKYITYKLDSTKFVLFGQKDTVIRYQAKDVVDAPITDNLGRTGWRVIRYLRDSASRNEADWKPNSTYMIVPTRESVEVIEDNHRYQKLRLPIIKDFSWKGNSFLDTHSIYSTVLFMSDWDYTYENIGSPFTPLSTPVANTITVNQRNETLGSVNNPESYSERNLSKEVYGKGIGLIYKDFLHWAYQPRTSIYPNGYKEGYGIRLRMIDHN